MSVSSSPHTARSAKGYRVIRPARQPVVEAPRPGLFRRLWQRLCALWQVTPGQWHAWQANRKAASGGDGLRVLMLSNGHLALIPPLDVSTTHRRPAQPDLP
ncbi:hypothetical protein [Deinococcus frigens]|uniref:hypothetical protein n=1 Tax=Deinococcus frigens TaxID=249403 RepID=UPI0012EBE1A5|nr:hypothetical protein [Deinococcus frigens]